MYLSPALFASIAAIGLAFNSYGQAVLPRVYQSCKTGDDPSGKPVKFSRVRLDQEALSARASAASH